MWEETLCDPPFGGVMIVSAATHENLGVPRLFETAEEEWMPNGPPTRRGGGDGVSSTVWRCDVCFHH